MKPRFVHAGLCLALFFASFPILPASAKEQVPIHGKEAGQVFVTGIPDPTVPNIVTITFTIEGIASHLGRYTLIGNNLFDYLTGCTLNGMFTLVTASGDQLFGTYDLCADPTLSYYTETLEITGGTGRFDGATGTLYADGVYTSLDPIFFEAVWEGTISTAGSAKH